MSSVNRKQSLSRTQSLVFNKASNFILKDESTKLPSERENGSSLAFQSTSNRMKINEQSSANIPQSMSNLEEFIMINDGVEYIFDFTHESIQNEDIFDIFQDVAKDLEFQMIQREENFSTAIKQIKNSSILSKLNLAEWLTGCFPSWNRAERARVGGNLAISKAPSAVKIVLSKIMTEGKQRKIGRVKGLSGLVREIKPFISDFKQKINNYLPEQKQISETLLYDIQKQSSQQNKKSLQYSDPYHLEISTFYVIQKILSNDIYEIGSITQSLIKDFLNTFQNFEESVGLIPQPISDAVKIINEIYYKFTMENQNQTKTKSKKINLTQQSLISQSQQKQSQSIKKIPLHELMTPFIRISIQKYIFQRLSSPIFDIYKLKNTQNEQIFSLKREKIFQKYSLRQILEQICLNEKFWGIDPQEYINIENINSRKWARQIVKMSHRSCIELENIPLTTSPREKIKHMQLAYTSLKTFYYDYSKGKYELSSMEDIIPVLILIVLLLDVEDLRKQLDIMGDFIECDPYEMESQKRLYINLSESYNYILRDWKVQWQSQTHKKQDQYKKVRQNKKQFSIFHSQQ